jgi:phospholipid/cholesterol/gamma-HCH transport system ATP-binding protein
MNGAAWGDFVRFLHVEKAFGEKRVYSDLTLSVRRGEVLTLLGGSGSGKSVALKLLIGLLPADAGSIEIDGLDVARFSEEEFLPIRRRISMLFQSSALFDSLSVGENIAYPLQILGGFAPGEVRDRVAQRLEMVGLPGTEDMMPSDLSGGMRKRVGLARAIVADPDMILYDEPTTGLDPVNTRRVNELILSIQERLHVTSLVVTHDLASAFMVSNRLAMLFEGRIVANLTPEEFRRTPERAVQEFIRAMPPVGEMTRDNPTSRRGAS